MRYPPIYLIAAALLSTHTALQADDDDQDKKPSRREEWKKERESKREERAAKWKNWREERKPKDQNREEDTPDRLKPLPFNSEDQPSARKRPYRDEKPKDRTFNLDKTPAPDIKDPRSKEQKIDRERMPKDELKKKEIYWRNRGEDVRKRFVEHKKRDHIFDDDFWRRFRRSHTHWYFDSDFYWNPRLAWPSITVWLPWKWKTPVYYYYGYDGRIYYSQYPDTAYLTPVDSRQKFVAEAVRIANAAYPHPRNQSQWKPLGMFALSYDSDDNEMPTEYFSLAITQDGALSGAYVNLKSNAMHELRGSVDPISQRAAWKFKDSDWPIMESGIYNLTQEESLILIHTSPDRTESRLIVQLGGS